jgi:UDP-2-acetamido-3-amino-2,3-dideoxy-glucuronate N-acetyltransferase
MIMAQATIEKSKIGRGTKIWDYAVVFGSEIGENCNIASSAEIGGAKIGNNCRIGHAVFICKGVTIEDNCFISQGVCFTNDSYPSVKKVLDIQAAKKEFEPEPTLVKPGVVIGANATILPGITIGKNAMIGAGAVVTKDVPDGEIWVGNPAKKLIVKK